MKRWRWVGLDVTCSIHDRQLAEHGGPSGIRDQAAIESALARPKNLAAYGKPDAAASAACYAYGLARNHGVIDSHKRTAWVVARLFLLDHGYQITFSGVEAVQIVEGLAAGTVSEEQLGDWFRSRLQPLGNRV
jgi:death-on-curing protein